MHFIGILERLSVLVQKEEWNICVFVEFMVLSFFFIFYYDNALCFLHDILSSISKMKSFGRKSQNSGIVTTLMHLDLLLILYYMWGGVNRTRMVTGHTNCKESDVL